VVTVIIPLNGQRLRINHHIDAKRGNLGGDIARLNAKTGDWESINVGLGTNAVWKWLEARLPKHDFFRSSIYLRQSETAHFLSGSATDRMKRFGSLIDLSRYTELSKQAEQRRDQFLQQQRNAHATLDLLGNRSDDALSKLSSRITELKQQIETAQREAEAANARVRGAREWHQRVKERNEQ
jgi:DNA repair exonuclease SbcCD ATPase subunit